MKKVLARLKNFSRLRGSASRGPLQRAAVAHTLNDLLDAAARRHGRRPALVTEKTRQTYAELRELVLRTAAGFHAAGVRRGDCVAIVHRNGPAFVIAYFALSRIGATAVPVNFLVQQPEDLAFMLNDCRAVAAVTQTEFLPGLRAAARLAPTIRRLWVSDGGQGPAAPGAQPSSFSAGGGGPQRDPAQTPFSELLLCEPLRQPHSQVSERDVAGILYTSGTTGTPKGVMLTHRNLVTNCVSAAAHMRLRRRDVVLCILPMFHTFAWTANVLVPIHLGLKMVVAPSVTPAQPWLKLMVRHGVTLFTAVPPIFAVLAKEAAGIKRIFLRWWFFRRVRLAISGAAPLSASVQKHFEKALNVPIYEGYGLTETSPIATINPPGERRHGSVGVAISGVQIRVIDEQGRALPPGQDGEICIKGDNIMKGYLNHPESTRAAFTDDGWFRSGDVGALDQDGYLAIKDRLKDMIIVKGLKVFSAQVEAALLEHPAVAEAAVIGVPDETGDETVKAFVVLRQPARTDRAGLLRHCRSRLDAYKRPRDIEIVDDLPKSALQKVLKGVLRRREMEKRAGRTQ